MKRSVFMTSSLIGIAGGAAGAAILPNSGVKHRGGSSGIVPAFECPPPKVCHPTPTPAPNKYTFDGVDTYYDNVWLNVKHGDTNGTIYRATGNYSVGSTYTFNNTFAPVGQSGVSYSYQRPRTGLPIGQWSNVPAAGTKSGVNIYPGYPNHPNEVYATWVALDGSNCTVDIYMYDSTHIMTIGTKNGVIVASSVVPLPFGSIEDVSRTSPMHTLPARRTGANRAPCFNCYHGNLVGGVGPDIKICCRCLTWNALVADLFGLGYAAGAAFFGGPAVWAAVGIGYAVVAIGFAGVHAMYC